MPESREEEKGMAEQEKRNAVERPIVLKFDSEYYFERHSEYLEQDRVSEAAQALRYAAACAEDNGEYDVYLGDFLYDNMQYALALESYFTAVSKNKEDPDALIGLSESYYALGDEQTGKYYYNRFSEAAPERMKEEIDNDYESLYLQHGSRAENGFRVFDPYSEEECESRLQRAILLMNYEGNLHRVIELLEPIPKTSELYHEAGVVTALCLAMQKKNEEAVQKADEIAAETRDLQQRCTLAAVYLECGATEKCERMVRVLKRMEPQDTEERFKMVMLMAQINDHEGVKEYGREFLFDCPLSLRVLEIYGRCYWNLKEFDRARDIFYDLKRIEPTNSIANYYLRLLEQSSFEFFEAPYNLPVTRIRMAERLAQCREYARLSSEAAAALRDEELLFHFYWAADYGTPKDASLMAVAIYFAKPHLRKHLEQAMISPRIPCETRRDIAHLFISYEKPRKLQILADDIFLDPVVRYPKGYADMVFAFRDAYGLCYATLVFSFINPHKKLPQALARIHEACVRREVKLNTQEVTALLINLFLARDSKEGVLRVLQSMEISEELLDSVYERVFGEGNSRAEEENRD